MKLSAIQDLVGGKLLTSPHINYFSKIVADKKKINRGDLFILKDKKDAKEARDLGAFGLIFEGELDFFDKELALIKVYDLNMAVFRLFRYFVASRNIRSIKLSNVDFDIFKSVIKDEKVIFVTSKNMASFLEIFVFYTPKIVFFYEDIMAQDVFGDFIFLTMPDNRHIKNLQSSLFHTNFSIKTDYFSVFVFKLFVPPLVGAINFAINSNMNYKIEKEIKSKILRFIYIDSQNKETKNGQSDRVLIFCEKYDELIFDFVSKNTSWGKFLSSENKTEAQLIESIKTDKFNFYLIFSTRKDYILTQISLNKNTEKSLFDD